MRQVFVSHSAADGSIAQRLHDVLLASSACERVVVSSHLPAGPPTGSAWEAWIRRTLRSCDLVVFLASDESATSVWCSAELGMARLLGLPVLPLRVTPGAALNTLVAHLQANPIDGSDAGLVDEVLGLLPRRRGDAVVPDGIAPYPGLVPLGPDQRGLLAGREGHVDRIVRDIEAQLSSAYVVSGPSGSGKSSLVRAGVVPELRERGWSISPVIQPRAASGLTDDTTHPTSSAERSLLVLDQAEEIDQLDVAERQSLVRLIDHRIAAGASVLVVVRSEFLATVGTLVTRSVDHYVPYLTASELTDVVRLPARAAQLAVDDALVERLVRETGSGEALPLLAYTLHELWEDRDRVAGELRASTLDRLGGVTGVLHARASEAIDAASARDPATTERILAVLSRLAEPNSNPPLRHPVRLSTLRPEERGWVDQFVRRSLLTYRRSFAIDDRHALGHVPTGDDLLDVTHEALFGWHPLAEMIDQRRRHNRTRLEVERSAAVWADSQADRSLLLRGDRLEFARTEFRGTEDELLERYVHQSVVHDRGRRRRRRLVQLALAAGVIAVVAATVAVVQRNRATAARQRAETAERIAAAVRVSAEAEQRIDDEYDVALLAAVAGYEMAATPGTEGALVSVLGAPDGPVRYFHDEQIAWSTLVAVDGEHGAVLADGEVVRVGFADGSLTPVPADRPVRPKLLAAGPDPGTLLYAGVHESSGRWEMGALGPDGAAIWHLDHDAEISALAASATRLVFGDAAGGVFAVSFEAPRDAVGIDRHDAGAVVDLDVSADGEWAASTSVGSVRAHRWTGRWTTFPLVDFASGAATSEYVVFAEPDGALLLFAAGADPEIRSWELGDAVTPLDRVGSQGGAVAALTADPSGRVLYSTGTGGSIRRWRAVGGGPAGAPLVTDSTVTSVLAAPTDSLLVSADPEHAVLWDVAPERLVTRTGVIPTEWAGERFAALVAGAGPLAAVTDDARVLVAGRDPLTAPLGTRRAWWTAGGRLAFETGDRAQLDLGPSALWTLDAGASTEVLSGAEAVAVGRCLAAAAFPDRLAFVDIGGCGSAPDEIALPPSISAPTEIALSPDERAVLVVARDSRLRTIDVGTGSVEVAIDLEPAGVPTSAVWLDDMTVAIGRDRRTVSSDPERQRELPVRPHVELVDLERREVTGVEVHHDAVWWLEHDPTRRQLFTAGQDGLIHQIDLTTGFVVGAPRLGVARQGENDGDSVVRSARLFADAEVLLAIHGSMLVAWEVAPGRLADLACERANRPLTPIEQAGLALDADDLPCVDSRDDTEE